jgi:hypothetical protein
VSCPDHKSFFIIFNLLLIMVVGIRQSPLEFWISTLVIIASKKKMKVEINGYFNDNQSLEAESLGKCRNFVHTYVRYIADN